jgi:hypothetical protein
MAAGWSPVGLYSEVNSKFKGKSSLSEHRPLQRDGHGWTILRDGSRMFSHPPTST